MKRYIVELEKGVWLNKSEGDPGRTLIKSSATIFFNKANAEEALKESRRYRHFKNAIIWQFDDK